MIETYTPPNALIKYTAQIRPNLICLMRITIRKKEQKMGKLNSKKLDIPLMIVDQRANSPVCMQKYSRNLLLILSGEIETFFTL